MPEIQRVPLEDVVLKILLFNLGHPEIFLRTCLEPPSQQQIRASIVSLADVGAVSVSRHEWAAEMLRKRQQKRTTSDGKAESLASSASFPFTPLTPLGYHLAQMPVDVRLGKMILYGCIFNCLEPVLTISAALGGKSIFARPPNVDDKEVYSAHVYFMNSSRPDYSLGTTVTAAVSDGNSNSIDSNSGDSGSSKQSRFFSDHLSIVNAFDKWQHIMTTRGHKAARDYCDRYYLSFSALEETQQLREMFRGYLSRTGFVRDTRQSNVGEVQYEEEDIVVTSLDKDIDDEDVDDVTIEKKLQPEKKLLSTIPDDTETCSSSNAMLRCILLAGLSPQVARVCQVPVVKGKKEKSKGGKGLIIKQGSSREESNVLEIRQADGAEVSIDRASITHKHVGHLLGPNQDQHARFCGKREAFLTYYKKQSTAAGKIYLHDCTMVPPIGVLLFSTTHGFAGDIVISKSRTKVEIGGWIRFNIQELHVVLLKQLHSAVERLLKDKVESPSLDLTTRKELLVKVVETLLDPDE